MVKIKKYKIANFCHLSRHIVHVLVILLVIKKKKIKDLTKFITMYSKGKINKNKNKKDQTKLQKNGQ